MSRSSYDATERGDLLEQSCHYAVGGAHEILDQIGRAVLCGFDHINNMVVVEQGYDFAGVEIERAVPVPQLLKRLGYFILQFELGLQVGGCPQLWRGRS